MRFPDRTVEIEFHRERAQTLQAAGDYDNGRRAYFGWVESLRQQNINTGGELQQDLEDAQREYSEFVKMDPLYLQIRKAALAKIADAPGILQTELYKVLSGFKREDISYAMYFAAEHGAIVRSKKGRTYELSLP